ncbi:hypothetical protein [Ralstonia solanacearum]|uniref:hypothetical protein n=2 Tax=Ralstonia solanacearum TaxID=305 RepID=UPI0005AC4689|nr:hypothetical protein [Ralstonia solanacearum]
MDAMDELIERWHAFSGQSKEEIAAQFSDESQLLFAEVLTTGLGNTSRGGEKFASADEFAQYVLDLRANEKAWSRHLGEVLLKAQERFDGGYVEDAKETLRRFRAECPWRSFAEIAETQLENFGG